MTTDWVSLTHQAAFASHRLIGWIYWDPTGIANYAALGVPDGTGYYIATRAAPLAAAGDEVVAAAFGSINPVFIAVSLQLCREHTTFEAAAAARDAAVVDGLQRYAPEICEPLAAMADELWGVADALESGGKVLFAAHRGWPRPDGRLLSAWLALNCIREWRGDMHWAIQNAAGLSMVAAMVLDGAWRNYADDWLPKSRGTDEASIAAAYDELVDRGLAEQVGAGVTVNAAGIEFRQDLEDQLDRLGATPWRLLGEQRTRHFIDLVEPVGDRLMERIDATAGTLWMPAGRRRKT